MRQILSSIESFFWNLFNRVQFRDVIDILIIAFLLYRVFQLTRQTRAGQVFKGFLLLILVSWLANLLGFKALNWLLMNVVSNGAVVLLILFQPELRRALEQFGRRAKMGHPSDSADAQDRIISEITQSVLSLSRRRVGALLVFEQRTGLRDFIDTGTTLDSAISSSLIINIFEPNTPLHDGAVIIRDDRIVAAGCVLTLSDSSSLGRELGTRHRAGLGVTEGTDAIVLIVSEETGIISMAQAGRLTRHLDADSLTRILAGMYKQDTMTWRKAVQLLLGRFSRREAGI
ncbi:MAG TPA: diadenylate cyclase CdaA [Candidatus Limnocylindria bacterium]|nr:diadenylate cyclase CdaA [Candidatus Limnocylindria bacterium]